MPAVVNLKETVLSSHWLFKILLSFQPEEWACLSVDLRLEAFLIKDSFSLNWTSEDGLVSNIQSIVEEYRSTRQLLVRLHSHQRCFTRNLSAQVAPGGWNEQPQISYCIVHSSFDWAFFLNLSLISYSTVSQAPFLFVCLNMFAVLFSSALVLLEPLPCDQGFYH